MTLILSINSMMNKKKITGFFFFDIYVDIYYNDDTY